MIVKILQVEIISTGTEPALVQRPALARTKTSEVTAVLPILENFWQMLAPPEKLLFEGWLALFFFFVCSFYLCLFYFFHTWVCLYVCWDMCVHMHVEVRDQHQVSFAKVLHLIF